LYKLFFESEVEERLMLVISEMVSIVEKFSQPPVCTGDVECTDCTVGRDRKMF
jgi:hypothetical protein